MKIVLLSSISFLGYKLIANEIIVGNGNIEGVGPQVINGVMTAINDKNLDISKYLKN